MCRLFAIVAVLFFAVPVVADDWSGKTIRLKEDGLKLGRKQGGGLVRDGAALDKEKTYLVKSDDGTFLELDGGFVFKLDAGVAVDAKPFPKPLKADEKVKTDGWFGKRVLPKRDSKDVRMGNWVDGKQETWTPQNLMNSTVREDRDGFVRVFDMRREGWVSKDDLVTAEDAPAWWDKAVQANPNDAYAWFMRGVGWLDKGESDNAVKDLTEAIRLRPEASVFYNSRGIAWHAKKETDKAVADYTEALRLDPKSSLAFNNRGNAWRDKKEFDKALADLTEAIRLDPKYAIALCNRGIALIDMGEYDKAVADCTEALRLDPTFAFAFNNRGTAWYLKEGYDKAVADFTAALRLDPKDAYAFVNRGNSWSAKKEYANAIADFDEALKLDPKNAVVTTNRGKALYGKKDYSGAKAAHEAALKLDPKSELALNRLTWLLACCPDEKFRDGKKAVELGKKLVEIDSSWVYRDTLASAYAEAGDFELAASEQRKAIEQLKLEKAPDPEDVKKAEARLELYRAKKPYRDE